MIGWECRNKSSIFFKWAENLFTYTGYQGWYSKSGIRNGSRCCCYYRKRDLVNYRPPLRCRRDDGVFFPWLIIAVSLRTRTTSVSWPRWQSKFCNIHKIRMCLRQTVPLIRTFDYPIHRMSCPSFDCRWGFCRSFGEFDKKYVPVRKQGLRPNRAPATVAPIHLMQYNIKILLQLQ